MVLEALRALEMLEVLEMLGKQELGLLQVTVELGDFLVVVVLQVILVGKKDPRRRTSASPVQVAPQAAQVALGVLVVAPAGLAGKDLG